MPKSIAVLGAGPALGQAVAHRYAAEGYTVVLVARSPEPLQRMADQLTATGSTAHAVTADLSDTQGVPRLAEQIRALVGDLDALYYGPSAGAVSTAGVPMPQRIQAFMPLALYTPVALVDEFLPHMVAQGNGAILIATGASAVRGMPMFRSAGPGLAAQRNYLQSLEVELAEEGVYLGRLYIGATIERSAWHARIEAEKAAGRPSQSRGPAVDPDHLAELLWSMHNETKQPEAFYPNGMFDH